MTHEDSGNLKAIYVEFSAREDLGRALMLNDTVSLQNWLFQSPAVGTMLCLV